mmetsp:Transcript_76697/g.228664  ORF Transcript_76697/g.228664 Transcript_76697/m.228664 type:complete len:225 (+) Transcript_76697:103-777(+)
MGASCQCERNPSCKVIISAVPDPPIHSHCTDISSAAKDTRGLMNQRLLVACRDDDISELKLALEEGAYLETRRPFVMRPQPPTGIDALMELSGKKKKKASKEGLTPLMYASQNGSVAATSLLLQAKAQVLARDEDGLRPLHFAAGSGVLEVCEILLRHGAERDAADEDGRRAIDYVPQGCTIMRTDREKWEALLGVTDLPRVAAAFTEGAARDDCSVGASCPGV